MNSRFVRLVIVLVVFLGAAAHVAADQKMVWAVQAELIERFTRFTDWPANSWVADANVPFTVGVLGDHGILGALKDIAREERIKGKRIEVRQLSGISDMSGCQAVFVAKSYSDQLEDVIRKASAEAVLTVADTPGFGKRGVMINFNIEGEFVRFEINRKAAEASGFRFADQLLRLGTAL